MTTKKDMKYTLFDMAYFYDHTADYMLKVGNNDKSSEMSYKYDALMAVIESLHLVEDYEMFVKTGELQED